MTRTAVVVQYIQTAVVLGVLAEFIDGATRHLRPPCPTCVTPHGWPFHYYIDPGFAGPGGWIWTGLTLDLLLLFGLSAVIVRLRQRSVSQPAPSLK
ncbi:hypothetical protein [Terriglobus albidus]|uniref:hypothetical protein n=1 Tax=Terriglobus albidus TaxID=1592106 RepID=UPI0021DFFD80|nr:hypothetical protein [Terriglobus albidus]